MINELTGDTLRSQTVSLKLCHLSEQASEHPDRVFTTLHHLIDADFLKEAYRLTRKDAAAGVDEVTAKDYAENLEANLEDLLKRYKEGKYRAPPVRRVWIGKEDGSQRPLGVPVFEDKILQRAVAMLLGAIYEVDFYDFSYGFRPKRSAHDALYCLRESCHYAKVGKIIDADVSKFFDNIPHDQLISIIKERVNDGKIIRFIGKWLNAGVVEDGKIRYPDCGSPQGGVISPLLANIFLHTVLDKWFVEQVQPRLKGRSFIVRFADDFTIGCERDDDAQRVMEVLPNRFKRFGLTIHPDKSKMIQFKWQPKTVDKSDNGTFDFLGFTHYWGKSRKGNWVIKRKTMAKRQRRTLRNFYVYCRNYKHEPIVDQFNALKAKLLGLYNYYGIRGNYRMLLIVFEQLHGFWRKWLGRRSRDGYISWGKFEAFRKTWRLPRPRVTKLV